MHVTEFILMDWRNGRVVKADGLLYGRTVCLPAGGSPAHTAAISRQHTAKCAVGLLNADMSNEHLRRTSQSIRTTTAFDSLKHGGNCL